jgi:hypothetical protein
MERKIVEKYRSYYKNVCGNCNFFKPGPYADVCIYENPNEIYRLKKTTCEHFRLHRDLDMNLHYVERAMINNPNNFYWVEDYG